MKAAYFLFGFAFGIVTMAVIMYASLPPTPQRVQHTPLATGAPLGDLVIAGNILEGNALADPPAREAEWRALSECYEAAKVFRHAELWLGHPSKDNALDKLREALAAVERAREGRG